ncbi:hypothetical protein YC2023_107094 [Brassica napus]
MSFSSYGSWELKNYRQVLSSMFYDIQETLLIGFGLFIFERSKEVAAKEVMSRPPLQATDST